MSVERLEVPPEFNRNAPGVAARGADATGSHLIAITMKKIGVDTLADKDILDVGCGVRFTQAIINRQIPIGSYTGIDVEPRLIQWLSEHVHDPRFRFVHWDVHTAMYNPTSTMTLADAPLPVAGEFDIIWLYSVFTHLAPHDADALLGKLRGAVRRDGVLFFSAFLDDALETFEDRMPEHPLEHAYYGVGYMRSLIEKNGWRIDAMYPREDLIQRHFVCRPM